MKQQFYLIFLLIFCSVISFQLAAQTSVQLPGGVQFYDDDYNAPYLLKSNEDVSLAIKNNIFVTLSISKKECFVGEPILVIYKLFTSLSSESKLIKQPEFTGCSVIEMTTSDLVPTKEIVNGKAYKSYIIRKVQLVPLQEGNLVLGTAEVENTIAFFKTIKEVENDAPFLRKNIILSNAPIAITVKPLPTLNKPPNFNNLVGIFKIEAKVNKLIDTATANNSLEITITGKGNFQNLVCPVINWPNSIEHFESESSESIDRLNFPISGSKKFTIPFSCKKEGKTTIPAIEFSFFNGDINQYKTISTDSSIITILPAVAKIDVSKFQSEVSNTKYIWIVPCIAIVVGLILWLTFFNKSTKNVINITTNIENNPAPIVTKTNAEKLDDLLAIDDDKKYYQAAKKLAFELIENEAYYLKRNELHNLINICNEALYGFNKTLTKKMVFETLSKAIF